jgi:hypothetical protein
MPLTYDELLGIAALIVLLCFLALAQDHDAG